MFVPRWQSNAQLFKLSYIWTKNLKGFAMNSRVLYPWEHWIHWDSLGPKHKVSYQPEPNDFGRKFHIKIHLTSMWCQKVYYLQPF